MPVRFEIKRATFTIETSNDGSLAVKCERPNNVGWPDVTSIVDYIRSKAIWRGWTLADELRVAQKIVNEFKGEILNFETIKKSLRHRWSKLLRRHLIRNPSHIYGQGKNEYLTPWYLIVSVQGGERYYVHAGGLHYAATFYLGDARHLEVYRTNKRVWRAAWERIRKVTFSYVDSPYNAPRLTPKQHPVALLLQC